MDAMVRYGDSFKITTKDNLKRFLVFEKIGNSERRKKGVVLLSEVNSRIGLLKTLSLYMSYWLSLFEYWPSLFCPFMDWDGVEVHKLAKKERG